MSLPWACQQLGISRRTLSNWLTQRGVWSQYLRPVWRVSYKTVLVPRAGVLGLAAWRREQLSNFGLAPLPAGGVQGAPEQPRPGARPGPLGARRIVPQRKVKLSRPTKNPKSNL